MAKKIFNVDKRTFDTLQNGDTLEIVAPKTTSITVWFPPARDPLGIGATTIEAGGVIRKTVYAVKGNYPFAIYSHADNKMLVPRDASGPEMIIQ